MKGNKNLLTVLNSLLADELTAINQYMVHSEMCANWGYSKLNIIKIGKTILEMISNDNNDELDAVRAYNDAIKLAREVDDEGTVELLTKILKMEEGHDDWGKIQRAQIEQMGMENYLVSQIDAPIS